MPANIIIVATDVCSSLAIGILDNMQQEENKNS